MRGANATSELRFPPPNIHICVIVANFNAITTMAAKPIQELMSWHLAVLKVDATHQFGSAEDDATVHLVFSDGPHAVLTLQQLGSFRPVF